MMSPTCRFLYTFVTAGQAALCVEGVLSGGCTVRSETRVGELRCEKNCLRPAFAVRIQCLDGKDGVFG